MARYPKCDAPIASVNIQPLAFKHVGGANAYGGISYCCCCPACDAVLGAALDPVALKAAASPVRLVPIRRQRP